MQIVSNITLFESIAGGTIHCRVLFHVFTDFIITNGIFYLNKSTLHFSDSSFRAFARLVNR